VGSFHWQKESELTEPTGKKLMKRLEALGERAGSSSNLPPQFHFTTPSTRGDLERWLETNNATPQKASSNRLGLAGSLFEALSQLLSSLGEEAQRASAISTKDACSYRNELERLFLWGDGFGAGDGELDNILDRSTELRVNVLSLLSELGKVATQSMFERCLSG
jgi:hypothetical protein